MDGTLIEAWASLKSFRPRTAAAPTAAAPTSTANSVKTTRMRALAIPTAELYRWDRAANSSSSVMELLKV